MLARNGREGLDHAERSDMSGMPQLLGEPAPRLLDVRGLIDRHRFSAKTYPVENRNPNLHSVVPTVDFSRRRPIRKTPRQPPLASEESGNCLYKTELCVMCFPFSC